MTDERAAGAGNGGESSLSRNGVTETPSTKAAPSREREQTLSGPPLDLDRLRELEAKRQHGGLSAAEGGEYHALAVIAAPRLLEKLDYLDAMIQARGMDIERVAALEQELRELRSRADA